LRFILTMRAKTVLNDIIEYISFMIPYDLQVGEIQNYLNSYHNTYYKYKDVYNFMNYYSICIPPIFVKETRCDHIYFSLA